MCIPDEVSVDECIGLLVQIVGSGVVVIVESDAAAFGAVVVVAVDEAESVRHRGMILTARYSRKLDDGVLCLELEVALVVDDAAWDSMSSDSGFIYLHSHRLPPCSCW